MTRWLRSLALVGLVLAGCDDHDQDNTVTPASLAPLGDAQLVTLLTLANQAEIDAGQLALARAGDASTRQFAADMVAMHSQALAMVQALGVAGQDSDASVALQNDAMTITVLLMSAATGLPFDLTYMCSQVRSHAFLLANLTTRAAPTSAQVAAAVSMATDMSRAHLDRAQGIVQQLGPNGAGGTGGVTSGGTGAGGGTGGSMDLPTDGGTNGVTDGSTGPIGTGNAGGFASGVVGFCMPYGGVAGAFTSSTGPGTP